MKLSTKMRYGTRVMVGLAMAYPQRAISVKELAYDQGLSTKYLEQIMAALKAAGLVKVIRGVHGGYALGKDPEHIRLIEVFRTLEGSLSLVDCVANPSLCEREEGCVTRDVWKEMNQALEKILMRTTIKDLVQQKRQKMTLPSKMYYI